jgi:hypothetical protein
MNGNCENGYSLFKGSVVSSRSSQTSFMLLDPFFSHRLDELDEFWGIGKPVPN